MTPHRRADSLCRFPRGHTTAMLARSRPAYCAFCEREQSFRAPAFSHVLHALLSIATAGLWLIPYLALWLHWRRADGWRCTECSHRYRRDGRRHAPPGLPPNSRPQSPASCRPGLTSALTPRVSGRRHRSYSVARATLR